MMRVQISSCSCVMHIGLFPAVPVLNVEAHGRLLASLNADRYGAGYRDKPRLSGQLPFIYKHPSATPIRGEMSAILSTHFYRRIPLSILAIKYPVVAFSPKYSSLHLPPHSRRSSARNYSATSNLRNQPLEQKMPRSKGDSSQKKEVAIPRPSSR